MRNTPDAAARTRKWRRASNRLNWRIGCRWTPRKRSMSPRNLNMSARVTDQARKRGSYVHGATDEFGFKGVENPVHVHDLHATLLQLLGFDHTKLTFRHAGRDFRLTDVHGNVIKELIG